MSEQNKTATPKTAIPETAAMTPEYLLQKIAELQNSLSPLEPVFSQMNQVECGDDWAMELALSKVVAMRMVAIERETTYRQTLSFYEKLLDGLVNQESRAARESVLYELSLAISAAGDNTEALAAIIGDFRHILREN